MIFEAVLYKSDNCLIVKLLSTDLTDLITPKVYWRNDKFSIQRMNSFAMDTGHIYLPGDRDFETPLPRSKILEFINEERCQIWIDHFTAGYREINKCEPIIINVEETGFHIEDSPEMRLG